MFSWIPGIEIKTRSYYDIMSNKHTSVFVLIGFKF